MHIDKRKSNSQFLVKRQKSQTNVERAMEKATSLLLSNECLGLKTEPQNTHLCPMRSVCIQPNEHSTHLVGTRVPSVSEKSVLRSASDIMLCFILLIQTPEKRSGFRNSLVENFLSSRRQVIFMFKSDRHQQGEKNVKLEG